MKRFVWIVLLGLIPSLASSVPTRTKSYQITKVAIQALVQSDGSLLIQESRTYHFNGSFRWADYRLSINGFTSVEDFRLRDETGKYLPAASETAGTYQLNQTATEFVAKWFYQAKNETRTFILSFRVTEVLRVYSDVAELYYKFVGSSWDHATQDVTVTVLLPEGASFDEIHAWAHGPLWGTVQIENASTVRLDVSPLPSHQFWEGRILLPARLLPQLPLTSNIQRLPAVIAEETRWAEEANQRRQQAQAALVAFHQKQKNWLTGLILLSLVAVGYWGWLFRTYGRSFRGTFRGKFYSEIPDDLPPALVGYLMNYRQINAGALLATLFDLARRGFLILREEKKRVKGWFKEKEKTEYFLQLNSEHLTQHETELLPFERDVLNYFFTQLANGQTEISLQEIGKSRSSTIKWFRRWQKDVTRLAKEKCFFDPESLHATWQAMIPAGVLFTVGIVAIVFVKAVGILPLLIGLVLFAASFAMPRVAREYNDKYKQWQALRRYLQKYHFEHSGTDRFQSFDRYLVYGLVLGLTTQRIKKLLAWVPQESQSTLFPWFIYAHSSGSSSFGDAFGSAVSSMVSVASTSLSSATGSGGGASAGGGGGAGGSGGGAG